MTQTSRRGIFLTMLAGAAAVPFVPFGAEAADKEAPAPARDGEGCRPAPIWGHGIEGQRKADLGNGTYLNPIIAGDHPDPTILKDGDDYYMTFSSFYSYPGIVIWHSTDLT